MKGKEEIGSKKSINFRIEPPKNNQSINVNLVSHYRLIDFLKNL